MSEPIHWAGPEDVLAGCQRWHILSPTYEKLEVTRCPGIDGGPDCFYYCIVAAKTHIIASGTKGSLVAAQMAAARDLEAYGLAVAEAARRIQTPEDL